MPDPLQYSPNSARYWYPRLERVADDLPVAVPETRFVEYEFTESFPLLDGTVPESLPWGEFVAATEQMGYPAFVRTDQKSVKHAGPGAYRAEEPDDVPTILATLTDHHVKANRYPEALMVREWIDIDTAFRAFDGLAIGREYRLFATPDEVLCHHFYWPADAFAEGRGTPTTMDGSRELPAAEWRARLGHLRGLSKNPHPTLYAAAATAVTALNEGCAVADDQAWSLDVAEDEAGDWWLIDAALAADSWHPDDCEHADGGGTDE